MSTEHDPLPTAEARIAWAASDDEPFNHDTLGDLLDYDTELEPGRVVYFGEVEEPDTDFVRAEQVIDMIGDAAYDIGGEHAEDFPRLSDEAREELAAFLSAWQAKHCKPTFYTVRNVKPYTLTDADFAEVTA